MPAGPNEQRLREYLEPARTWQVYMAQRKWHDGAEHLKKVADAVQNARPLARENLGTYTADAADTAFVAMHDKVLARHQQMKDGDTALGEAMEAIQRAEAVRNGFDAVGPLSEPSAPAYDDDEVRQIQQMTVHKAQVGLYNDRAAAREEAAAAAIRDLDRTNTTSAEAMRKIQGERPDLLGGGGGGGAGGGGLLPGGGRNPTRGPGPRVTNPPTNPPTNLPTSPPPQETGTPLGPGTGSTTLGTPGSLASPGVTGGSGNIGGVAGAVGGGLAGGAMGMGGAIRSGIGSAAAPGGATRGIGSSGRTGSSGALGRAAVAGSTAGRAAGAGSTAGRAASAGGAAGAGAGAGGRGQAGSKAGGCGAPGGADGRGGRKNQDDKSQRIDAIIDDQDWVDDEDAAPGVIS